MANVHKPSENIKSDPAFVSIVLTGGGTAVNPATYYPMTNYDLCWFLIHVHLNAGVAGSLSCQMWQRVGALGALAVLKAAQVVTAVGVNAVLFARGEDFTATYTHVGVICTEGNMQPVTVSGILLRLRARYKQATLLA